MEHYTTVHGVQNDISDNRGRVDTIDMELELEYTRGIRLTDTQLDERP